MSDQELYEIARRRIDSRNRRWTLWAVDLLGLIFSLVLLIALSETTAVTLAAAFFMAWGGVFTIHTILVVLANTRARDIAREIARLREEVYEKPKRLEMADDGELIETADDQEDAVEAAWRERQRAR